MDRLVGIPGILLLLGVAWLLCPRDRRSAIRPALVAWGVGLQFLFAVLILHTPANAAFNWANDAVMTLLDFTRKGSEFVFGSLVSDRKTLGYILAFQALPPIVFFSALMAVLYHLGIMPAIIRAIARVMMRFLGTSGAETFSAAADIFVGMTEAPLVIRPYLSRLTQSELLTVMAAGTATVAGGVMAAYVGMLRSSIPDIAGHLMAASVMAIPASVAVAKIMLPETEKPDTAGSSAIALPKPDVNLIDAAARGATEGMRLAVNVAAMLIAFIALVAMVNHALGWAGLSLQRLLGWVFAPVAFLLGVPVKDAGVVGDLLGQKIILNEFVAYSQLARYLQPGSGVELAPRSALIASYALCGFANLGSIAIQVGGIGALAPDRRADLARLGVRAMIAGALATSIAAATAGLLVANP